VHVAVIAEIEKDRAAVNRPADAEEPRWEKGQKALPGSSAKADE
jgi:hypothetical protein